MKGPAVIGVFLGIFWAILGFIIVTVIDGPAYGAFFGLGGGVLFGAGVAAWCAFVLKKDKKRSDAFVAKHISGLVYQTEGAFFEGKKIRETHIYVTGKVFRFVVFKGKKAVIDTSVPISGIMRCVVDTSPRKSYAQATVLILTPDHTSYHFSLIDPQGLYDALTGLNPAILYFELRQKALSVCAEGLGLSSDYAGALAILVDMAQGNGYTTLACFADDTVSLYSSDGGDRLGLGQAHPEIRQESDALFSSAERAVSCMEQAESAYMPENSGHRLYLIMAGKTYAQDYAAEESGDIEPRLQAMRVQYRRVLAAIERHR